MKNNTLLYAGAAVAALLLLKNKKPVSGVGAFRYPANEFAAGQLYMYADNSREVYDRFLEPLYKNLAKKIQNGTYDHTKAIKAFEPAVMYAAKLHNAKYAYIEFTPATRHLTAEQFASYIEGDWYNWV